MGHQPRLRVFAVCSFARHFVHGDHHTPQVGWKHQDAVAELEAVRKEKSKAFYEAKKKQIAARAKAAAA